MRRDGVVGEQAVKRPRAQWASRVVITSVCAYSLDDVILDTISSTTSTSADATAESKPGAFAQGCSAQYIRCAFLSSTHRRSCA